MVAPNDPKVSTTPWSNRFVFSLVSSVPQPLRKYMPAKRRRDRTEARAESKHTGPMSQVKVMLTNLLPMDAVPKGPFTRNVQWPSQAAPPLPMDRRRGFSSRHNEPAGRETRGLQGGRAADPTCATVEISPPDIVRRHTFALEGMTVETVEATSCEKIEYRFRAARHLLVVCEQGERSVGDTFVEGLPKSSLRDLKKKLTFVPAGHEYHERQEPRISSRVLYFYFDPAKMPTLPQADAAGTPLSPRLFFEDTTLWDTAVKLRKQSESAGSDHRLYFEALGVVLAHELVRLNAGIRSVVTPVRGGLAGWQQRIVTSYIEEHLSEQIPLTTLARLVRLSPYYFCRAFKQSLGMPPHRYHNSRRIEQAKTLLAKPGLSVTDIGLTVGFGETSSFSAAFRKATGFTPSDYHRNL
jgi:AraC family transcriptional regulator